MCQLKFSLSKSQPNANHKELHTHRSQPRSLYRHLIGELDCVSISNGMTTIKTHLKDNKIDKVDKYSKCNK